MRKIRSVKELLTEMKDLAVLCIDLAYGSVLFNSKEIAEEVIEIAEEMDKLRDELEKRVLRSATPGVNEDDLIGILRLAAFSERISNNGAEIAIKVKEGKIHDIEKRALSEAEEKFIRLKIEKDLSTRKIAEIGDIKNVWIIAIKRGKSWIYHPNGKMVVKLNDIIFGLKS